MSNPIASMLRASSRKEGEPLNILTAPTHEAYESNLCKTGHNFYAIRAKGIKDWNTNYRPLPDNYTLLDPNKGQQQLPLDIDFDVVLSQNKFGQFQVLSNLARLLQLPLISLEHTLPVPQWPEGQVDALKQMRGHINVFISEYSREKWGWRADEAEVIHHGIDTSLFMPDEACYIIEQPRTGILSIVNDWINRDWCCFVAGTRIPTVSGEFFNIEDINLEHKLFSDSDRTINKLVRRKYSGELIEIDFGYGNIHTVTPEHPYILNNGTEVLAKDLQPKDDIRFNFPEPPRFIDLSKTLDCKYTIKDGYIRCKGNTTSNITKCIIDVDNNLLHFLGWYLAEGSVSQRNIEFDLSNTEEAIAKSLLDYGNSIGIKGFIRKNSRGNSIRIIFSSKPMADFLSKTFGRCSGDKKIPANLMHPSFTALFGSLIDGDGTYNEKRLKFDSKSRNLVESVFMFYAQFGIVGKISKYTRSAFGVTSDLWTVNYTGERMWDILNFKSGRPIRFGIEVQNISKRQVENIDVYNFNVSNDNLYMTLYGLTHNCGFNLWKEVTKGLKVNVVGDTPGLSKPASSTEELVREYQDCDIFLNTSLISPVPTALMEAMACGCACVSTATCMIPEVITHGVDGFLSNDPQELRKYCQLLLNDHQLASKMGAAARKTIMERYNLEQFVKNWNIIFDRATKVVNTGDFN